MTRFHLDFQPKRVNDHISHLDKIFLCGSCFAENIGELLQNHRFDALTNAAGIFFNPASVARFLQQVIRNDAPDTSAFLWRDGRYYSFLHHSSVQAANTGELAEKISAINEKAHRHLLNSRFLVLTFGTAFVYRHRELGRTVANCHRQPQQAFVKKLLPVQQIVSNYQILIRQLQTLNPQIRIIFSVSPVKYLRDGIEENSLSKSTLLLSVHELVKRFDNCFYFPAFELVNDDLRDYRFYEEDLAHPNAQAIHYVWEKFSDTWFNEETRQINTMLAKLHRALMHRKAPGNEGQSEAHNAYIENLKAELRAKYAFLNL